LLPDGCTEGKRTRLRGGDILLSVTAELGLVGYVDDTLAGDAYVNQHVALLRVLDSRISNEFLAYYLASNAGRRAITRLNDAGAKAGLSLEKLRGLEVRCPPVGEQAKTAEVLRRWETMVDLLAERVVVCGERKRGLMQRLLAGKTRFKGERWQAFKLGELFTERVEIGREDLPLVSITGQNGVVPRDSLAKRDTSSEDKSRYLRIAPGDIGYNTMRMWQGVSGLSKLEGIVSPAYTICVPSKRIDGQFAAYLFKHAPVVHLFRRHSQGLVDDTLALKFPNFARIYVTIPDVPEQHRIAAVLSACDREIELLQKQLEALKEQKRGLMQKLLTGEVRVKAGGSSECGMRSAELPRTGATSGKG
jgi:type I restriction enzyme S subunit